MKYINTNRNIASSEYMEIEPEVNGSSVRFDVKKVAPVISGFAVPMVKFDVFASLPTQVNDPCGSVQVCANVSQTLKITGNVLLGDSAQEAALRTEVNRVLDMAISQHYLLNGVVPPVDATFASQ